MTIKRNNSSHVHRTLRAAAIAVAPIAVAVTALFGAAVLTKCSHAQAAVSGAERSDQAAAALRATDVVVKPVHLGTVTVRSLPPLPAPAPAPAVPQQRDNNTLPGAGTCTTDSDCLRTCLQLAKTQAVRAACLLASDEAGSF